MSAPTFTIITAVYNGRPYITDTINSVLSNVQGFSHEYLVVDDGSTDGTHLDLAQFGDSINVFSRANSGESAAVSFAIQQAKGTFCLVVSADDPLMNPELFARSEQLLYLNPNVSCIYPDWQMIDAVGGVIKKITVPNYSEDELIGNCRTLPGPGAIFRTSWAKEINGRNPKWVYVGDYDFWLRLSRQGPFLHLDKNLAQWRYHENSTSISKRNLDMAEERIAVIREFLEENEINSTTRRAALGNSYFMAARLVFFDKKVPAKKYLAKSLFLGRKWCSEYKISIILYILFYPLSRLGNQLIKRSRRFRTLI
jgi:glycosyltransferase involved in cell wall biosynthesis